MRLTGWWLLILPALLLVLVFYVTPIVQVLAILAACLALFSLGLWRGRHIPQPARSHS